MVDNSRRGKDLGIGRDGLWILGAIYLYINPTILIAIDMDKFWNIALLWRNSWEDTLNLWSVFTIETTFVMITA